MQFSVSLQFTHTSMMVRHIQIQSGVWVGGTDIISLLFCGHVIMKLMACLQFIPTSMRVIHIQIQPGVLVDGRET
jgi:hypothetical protein